MATIRPVFAAAAVLLATGCAPDLSPARAGGDGDAEVLVVADDMVYEPTGIQVTAGRSTVVELRNDGGSIHDLVLDTGWESGVVRPGETVIVELGALERSTVGWCSVPGHRDAGMELEINVSGPATSRPAGSSRG